MLDNIPMELSERFAREKYAVLRQCLTEPQLSLFYRYARRRAANNPTGQSSQVPTAYSNYGDIFMEGLLVDMLPIAQRATLTTLSPTYSYFRVYKRGDVLARHIDRPSCEISLSICLGCEPHQPWPLWIEGPQGVASIELAPGDALVYRGIDCPHWREPLEGDLAAQVFLHYVDQSGPLAEWRFDKRVSLSDERSETTESQLLPLATG